MKIKSILHPIIIIALIFNVAEAAETDNAGDFKPLIKPTINIPRVNSEVKIDGELDESIWDNAAVADNFSENNPGDNVRPPVASRALLAYDENNLYVALIASDNPEEIRASLRERDNIFRDDYFGIMLDTYGDLSWGYEIFVNPLGLQGDLRMITSGDEDISFDLVFYSKGVVTDSGYQVEMSIPFASLRFPNTAVQKWRVNFWRDRQRENRNRYAWAAMDRDNPCFMCQWGYLTGIENIRPSSSLEILPNIIGYQSGALTDQDNPDAAFESVDPDAELSLNLRYGVSSNSSVEIAVNPDFSQVESDASQIDVNSTFSLFFPERRPFFQEGSDLYGTWIRMVHTRTIFDPQVAGKFTGRFGRNAVGYITALDDNTRIKIPGPEYSDNALADRSFVNIIRFRHTFGEDSQIGFLGTDRHISDWEVDGKKYRGGSGSTYGMDFKYLFWKNVRVRFQAVGSYTHEPDAVGLLANGDTFDNGKHTFELDGESFSGQAIYGNVEYTARTAEFNCAYWEFSPTFRADNGFSLRNDTREIDLFGELNFYPNREWLVQWSPQLSIGRVFEHSGVVSLNPGTFGNGPKDEWISPVLGFVFKGQTELRINYLYSREKFAGGIFPGISRISGDVDSRFSELLSGGTYAVIGKTLYRDSDNPELGYQKSFGIYASLKPSQRLFTQPELSFEQMEHRQQYLDGHPDENRVIYRGFILRTRTTYQFTREWYLRLIVEYDDFGDRLTVEPLLTWQLNPFSVFYVGMNSNSRRFDDKYYNTLNDTVWRQTSVNLFAKLQYLFRV